MVMSKAKTKKDKRKATFKTNNSAKRINQELRSFKSKLHRLVDKTRIVWTGPKYQNGSNYRIVLDSALVEFVFRLIAKAQKEQDERDTKENAEELKKVIVKNEEDKEKNQEKTEVEKEAKQNT
jgi:hypothetical protein